MIIRPQGSSNPRKSARMLKLEVEPLARFGWDFRVTSQARELATLSLTRFRDRGRFELDRVEHTIEAEGFFRPVYRLERGKVTVARAEPQGWLRRSYAVTAGDRVLTLRRKGFFSFTYVVEHGRTALGEIRRLGVLTRRAEGELDERIDPTWRIFLVFLVVAEWRRQARSSG
jgi:hypothetical protein